MYLLIYGIFALIILLCIVPITGANFIFGALAVILAVILFMRNKDIYKNINKIPEKALHPVNLEKGGVFELHGVGKDCADLTLTVIAKHLYREGDFSWFELECDKGSEEKVWVEVEDDDETTVSVVLKKLKLADVHTTPSRLKEIDDNECGSVDGYKYEDSGDAVFYRFCDDEKPEKLYYWDFVKGNEVLSVEKWGEKDYEVFISQKMRPAQVRVLRNLG